MLGDVCRGVGRVGWSVWADQTRTATVHSDTAKESLTNRGLLQCTMTRLEADAARHTRLRSLVIYLGGPDK